LYQDRLDRLLSVGDSSSTTTTSTNDKTQKPQQKQQHVRDVKWLEENGHCLDNLQPKRSKIKRAGRGAFATRYIPAGTLIIPSPVVQITNASALQTTYIRKNRGSSQSGKTTVTTQPQLLLNYCYGHVNSSVLFLPLAPIVNLINHSPTTGDGGGANARVQWSTSTQHRGREWPITTHTTIEDLRGLKETGFMFDYVATRDIQPGDEVLIDYGEEWVSRWEAHEREWEMGRKKEIEEEVGYTPAYVMEDIAGWLRTYKRQVDHPYLCNLITSCF